jgi:hypothetical protein
MAKGMTKAEKIGIYFSAAALIISVVSPIVTYLWLDPNLKAFKDRARLQVSGEYNILKKTEAATSNKIVDAITSFNLSLLNIGKSPAKEIQIVAQYKNDPPSNEFFTLDPPSQYEVRNQGSQSFITLKRPIPVEDSLSITFKVIPILLSVSTESGETSVISTGFDVFQAFDEAIKRLNSTTLDQFKKELQKKDLNKP